MYDKKTLMRYGRIKWGALIAGVLLSIIGFSMFGSELQDSVFRIQNKGNLNEVRATVVNFVETSGETAYTYHPVVEYEIEGRTYTKQFDSAGVNSFGAQVELLYNPANPQYAVLSSKDIEIVAVVAGIVIFIIGIQALFAFVSSVRRRRRVKDILGDFKETGDEKALGVAVAWLNQSEQNKFPLPLIAFGAIFMLIGLGTPLIINNTENTLKHTNKTFIPVTAKVIDNGVYIRSDTDYGASHNLLVQAAEYEANGVTYVRILNRSSNYVAGDRLSLKYDPNNPGYTAFAGISNGNAVLIGSFFGIPFFMMGLIPTIYGIKHWRSMRSKSKNQIN